MTLYEKLPTPRSIRVLSFKKPVSNIEDVLEHLEVSTEGHERLVRDPQADAVHCNLSIISLSDQESFDALSYVWGDPFVKEQFMVCNGESIPITFNLWAALHQIWEKWPEKKLWVDAICINQDDIPERNEQVTMMGSIYKGAKCVVVWLGEATQKSTGFFKVVEKVQNGVSLLKITVSLDSEDTANRIDNSTCDLQRNIVDLANDVLFRPWFRRAWTLQEIQLARKAIICCGTDVAGLQVFLRSLRKFKGLLISSGDLNSAGMIVVPSLKDVAEDTTFLNLLVNSQERQASDLRDKIYSLISMLPSDIYNFMEADYSLSVQATFTWACRVLIELDREIHCLHGAGLWREEVEGEENFLQGLPSWVPDLTKDNELYVSQDLYRRIREIRTNPELLRNRSEHGRRLDRKSRKIGITGVGVGRLEIDREEELAFLTRFPACALETLQSQPIKTPSLIELSSDDFFDFCERINKHDIEQCECIKGLRRPRYGLNSMPKTVKDGDWIWTPINDNEDGTYPHHQYVLRPVEATSEAQFQLVQMILQRMDIKNYKDEDEGISDEDEDIEYEDGENEDEENEDEENEDEEDEDQIMGDMKTSEFVKIQTTFVLI